MIGEPMHTASIERIGAVHPSHHQLSSEKPLRFVVSYVQPVAQHYESRTVQKVPL